MDFRRYSWLHCSSRYKGKLDFVVWSLDLRVLGHSISHYSNVKICSHADSWGSQAGGNGGPSLSQEYVHTCKALLSYFHFTYKGSAPLFGIAELNANLTNPEQVEYLRYLQTETARQGQLMLCSLFCTLLLETCVAANEILLTLPYWYRGTIGKFEEPLKVQDRDVLVLWNVL